MIGLDKNCMRSVGLFGPKRSAKENIALFERYHELARIRSGLTDEQDLANLVHKQPYTAAQIFYSLQDNEIGELIVNAHSSSHKDELRRLATGVGLVLDARKIDQDQQYIIDREDMNLLD